MNEIELKKLEKDFKVFNKCWDFSEYFYFDNKKYISKSGLRYFLEHKYEMNEISVSKQINLLNTNGMIFNLIDNKLIKSFNLGWVVL